MARILILATLISTLAACGVSAPADEAAEEALGRAVPSPTAESAPEAIEHDLDEQAGGVSPLASVPAERAASPTPYPDEAEVETVRSMSILVHTPFLGQTTVKEKVVFTDTVVRATMTSVSAEIDTGYLVYLKFNLKVSEYLRGTGPSNIVAIWVDSYFHYYDTRAEAEARKAAVLAERDSQWDDREAVIFMLDDGPNDYGPKITELLGKADHFFLARGELQGDDYYSLHSRSHKGWLPSVTAGSESSAGATDAGREYLLDVPPKSVGLIGQSSSSQTPTVTLTDLKATIKEVVTEIDAGDGSDAYEECIREKYGFERHERQRKSEGKDLVRAEPSHTELVSGRQAGTVLLQRPRTGIYPDRKSKTWFEGADAALLEVVQVEGDTTPYDIDRDGRLTAGVDRFEFTQRLTTTRPLPAGEYSVVRKEVWAIFLDCNYVLDSDWTITVTAPSGTLHEMFFDPVTVGTAVAADATNGVLEPRAFTGASGAAATIGRIAYEPAAADSGKSAQVTMEVTPDDALSGQVVDFIGLDGTVSFALSAATAAVDAANDILSWPVASQPWESGDKLMVRIRSEPQPTPEP